MNAEMILLLVLNLPVFLFIGRVVFGNWDSFFESLKWCLSPDFISRWQGNGWEDMKGELFMMLFLGLCGLLVWGESTLFHRFY